MRSWTVVLGVAGALLTACGPSVGPKLDPQPQPPAPRQEEPAAPTSRPLGGTIAVIVDNLQDARPQTGIDQGSVVVEALAEGPITRFEIFLDHEVDKIGPVRSLRPYFAELAQAVNAPVAHAGGSPDALSLVRKNGWPDLDEIYNAGSAFWRDPHRQAPHNLYTNTDRLVNIVRQRGYSLGTPVPVARGSMSSDGPSVREIRLHWYDYSVSWKWDGHHFLREENGTPHLMENGTPIQADNIAVVVAPDQIVDQAGRRQIDLTGSGKAWFFIAGRAYEGTWSRTTTGWFQFSTPAETVRWTNGPLWIEVISDPSWLTAVR